MRKSKQALVVIFFVSAIFLSACSDKYYEMYKSPCACLFQKDLQNEIEAQTHNDFLNKTLFPLCRSPKIGLSFKAHYDGNSNFYQVLKNRKKGLKWNI